MPHLETSPDEEQRSFWQVYCDDLDVAELHEAAECSRIAGSVHEWNARGRCNYDSWNAARNDEKSGTRQYVASRLGVQVDGCAARPLPQHRRRPQKLKKKRTSDFERTKKLQRT